MFKVLLNLFANISAGHGTSFLSVSFGSMIFSLVKNIFVKVYNFFLSIIWLVLKWFLGALDACQMIVTHFLGIDTGTNNEMTVGKLIEGFKQIFSGGNNYYEMLMRIFRALTAVAIILMIVFSIFAMIMQEWNIASKQEYKPGNNEKAKIIKNMLVNIMMILLMPLTFYFVLTGTNAILTSFYRGIGNNRGTSIGGQVLASATYDANRYRSYANNDKRIPIIIQVYDPYSATAQKTIKSKDTQNKLKAIAGAFANNSFLSFEKSTVYDDGYQYEGSTFRYNNQVFAYGKGDDPTVDGYLGYCFENFICTREQYYVMADFIDYCQLYNLPYYIKATSEPDIDWKYVDSSVITVDEMYENGTAEGVVNLEIVYRDADDVEQSKITPNGAAVQNHKIIFTTEQDVISSVSDALTTVSTLLGIDENSAMYNVMERDDSGDYVNLVSWANEKALLQLNENFELSNPDTWNKMDQIIIYEYFNFSSNNTLEDYTIEQLKAKPGGGGGALIDVQTMTFMEIGWSTYKTKQVIKLNNAYYDVDKLDEDDDYYSLVVPVESNSDYFEKGSVQIKDTGDNTTIKLSNDFDMNNKATWTVSDAILVYEYYSNISLSNDLRKYQFNELKTTGITLDVYNITKNYVEETAPNTFTMKSSTGNYVYINGIYYQVDADDKFPANLNSEAPTPFLVASGSGGQSVFRFGISGISDERRIIYGVPEIEGDIYLTSQSADFTEVEDSDVFYQRYSNVNLKLSENFDYTNQETWSFRDYLIFYIYTISNQNSNIEMLKLNGIEGVIGKINDDYYLRTKSLLRTDVATGEDAAYYLNLDTFENISDLNILHTLENEMYEDMEMDETSINVEVGCGLTDNLYTARTEIKTFEVSENFDPYNPQSWTVGDYYLVYFSNMGIINRSINVIMNVGYNSLVYEVDYGGGTNKWYRFGGDAKTGSDKLVGTYYINSGKIPSGYTIDEFFSLNLMNFVLAQNDVDDDFVLTSLSYSREEFNDRLYDSFKGYVYDLGVATDSTKSLIKKLVEQYNSSNGFEAITNYVYRNDNYDATDPSTWTNMDIAIAKITGGFDGVYSSKLIEVDSKKYFLVDNKLIYIESSVFNCLVSASAIISSSERDFADTAAIDTFYSSELETLVKDSIPNAKYYSDAIFTYTSTKDLSSLADGGKYTPFDIIIAKLNKNEADKTYQSYLYKDSSDKVYFKLDNKYIEVSKLSHAHVVFSQVNSISSNVKPFAIDSTIESQAVSSTALTYLTKFDAFAYELTQSTSKNEYNVYKKTSGGTDRYIYFGGRFVNIDGLSSALYLSQYNVDSDNAADVARNKAYISYLYFMYYKDLFSYSSPYLNSDSEKIISNPEIAFKVHEVYADSTKFWTPLGVILYANGIITDDSKTINGKTYVTKDGREIYLKGEYTNNDDNTLTYYVNITSICNRALEVTDLAKKELFMHMNTLRASGSGTNVEDYTVAPQDLFTTTDSLVTFAASDICDNGDNYKYSYDNTYNAGADDDFDIDNPGTWTWIDVLYYYYNGSFPTGAVKIEKYLSYGNEYLKFTKDSKDYYYEICDNLKKLFKDSTFSTQTINFGSISSSVNLVIEAKSKATEESEATYKTYYYVVPYGISTGFYYFKDIVNNYYGIIGLDAASTQSLDRYTINSGSLVTSGASSQLFTYMSKDFDNVKDWTILDFVLGYLKGSSNIQLVNGAGYKYTYGSVTQDFFVFNGEYVNFNIFDEDSISWEVTGGTTYTGGLSSIKTLASLMSGDIVVDYDSSTDVKTAVTAGKDALAEPHDTAEVISFSANFDPSDYTTWTMTDYLMYYVFVNGAYINEDPAHIGDTTFEVVFNYTYTPSYTYLADARKYANLTQLDLAIARANASDIDNASTWTLPETPQIYSFVAYKSGSDVFIKVIGSARTIYVGLGSAVSMDTSTRTISSAKVSGFIDNLKNEYNSSNISSYCQETEITTEYKTTLSNRNLQSFINIGGLYARIYYILKMDEYGDSQLYKVADFNNNSTTNKNDVNFSDVFYNYDVLINLHTKNIASNIKLKDTNRFVIEVSANGETADGTSWEDLYEDFVQSSLKYEYQASYTYDSVTGKYSNLTYLDLAIARANATSLDNASTWTLPETAGTYEFEIYIEGSKYIEIIGSQRNVYVQIDDYVSVNNTDREIYSTILSTDISNLMTRFNQSEFKDDCFDSETRGILDYSYLFTVQYDVVVSDFSYENYYYYNYDIKKLVATSEKIFLDSTDPAQTSFQASIKNGTAASDGTFNLKLHSGFSLSADMSTWTWTDFIIMNEFSNDVRHNIFDGMNFSEVLNDDYYINVYNKEGVGAVIYINGNFYRIDKFTTKNESSGIWVDTGSVKPNTPSRTILSKADMSGYAFRTLVETYQFSVNHNYMPIEGLEVDGGNLITKAYRAPNNEYTISYKYDDGPDTILAIRELDKNLTYTMYKTNLLNLETYDVKPLVKQVSWVEKLMTDMQVYYPDLNWSTLIATDGWLDTLGEYVSAYTTGLYVSDNNSSNVTAAGIVLSEFFISVAKPVENSYADYEYSSMFEEETIHALMRSLMGRENFEALTLEAELFMDFFNSVYAPILDDLSYEFGETVYGGSLRMCVYKAFLSTILLGSDIGEYLYTVATRVYAEYTIGEYLAIAGGDYAGYYSYVNDLPDENGEDVTSFTYGSFAELVMYENEFCGNANPTFTFNVKKAYLKYISDESSYNAWLTSTVSNEQLYYSMVYKLVDKLLIDYTSIYERGNQISEDGEVLDSEGEVLEKDAGHVYCYMLHTYCSIDYATYKNPYYVEYFLDYMRGDITRWEMVKDETIEDADEYLPNKTKYELQLQLHKLKTLMSMIKLITPSLALNSEEADNSNILSLIMSVINGMSTDGFGETIKDITIVIPATHAAYMLHGSEVLDDLLYIYTRSLPLYFEMFISEGSGLAEFLAEGPIGDLFEKILNAIGLDVNIGIQASWNRVVEYRDKVNTVILELEELTEIAMNEKTPNGSTKKLDNPIIEVVMNKFSDVKLQLDNYIATQRILDKIYKRSITFTLGQFGANYVSSGFSFNVKNKDYRFKSTVDSSRLAEYVYGGAFLESVGVGAQYTNPEFTGIISANKVYDSVDKAIKTKLNCWPQLRGFACNIADYTATIYYLTNLGDLSPNHKSVLKLTDNVYYANGTKFTNLEMLILRHFISDTSADTYISSNVLARLIVGSEPGKGLENPNQYAYSKFGANAKALIDAISDENNAQLDDGTTRAALLDYLDTIYNQDGGGTADNDPTPSPDPAPGANKEYADLDVNNRFYKGETNVDIIHEIFCKVMNYLLVSDAGDGSEIRVINLDNISFEKFKTEVIKSVILNKQYTDESSESNARRYLALFKLVNSEFEFSCGKGSNPTQAYTQRVYAGRFITKDELSESPYVFLENGLSATVGGVTTTVGMNSSYQTEQSVLKLANLENRPTADIVKAEISGEAREVYDEAVGDTFIVCSYNPTTNLYVPLLATNGSYSSTNYNLYVSAGYPTIDTEYYNAGGAFPIVAKGIITADGYPTAIRKHSKPLVVTEKTLFSSTETVYNSVTFYRNDLGANTGVGANYAQLSQAVNRVSTKNYTSFTMSSSFTSGIGSGTTYTGKDNIKSSFKSDVSANYIQLNNVYLIAQADEYGAISVLDEFSHFYLLGGQSLILCIMALLTLFPILVNASLGAMRRILDLLILFLISPMVIAMRSISEKNQSKSFNDWVKDMQGALFGCIGYIVGFSSYFILWDAIYNVESFLAISTYQSIFKIGGLGNFITYNLLNSILRCMWIVAGVYIIKSLPKLLLPIISGQKVISPDSPIGTPGPMTQKIKNLTNDLSAMAKKAGAVMSGKALLQIKDAAISTAFDMIPGAKLLEKGIDIGKTIAAKRDGKEIEKALVGYGVDKDKAKQAGTSVANKKKEQLAAKKKKKADNAANFKKTFETLM